MILVLDRRALRKKEPTQARGAAVSKCLQRKGPLAVRIAGGCFKLFC